MTAAGVEFDDEDDEDDEEDKDEEEDAAGDEADDEKEEEEREDELLAADVAAKDELATADAGVEDSDELVSAALVDVVGTTSLDELVAWAVGVRSLGGVCPGWKLIVSPVAAGNTAMLVNTGLSLKTYCEEDEHTHPPSCLVTMGWFDS